MCTAVNNIMGQDFTLLESYHNGNLSFVVVNARLTVKLQRYKRHRVVYQEFDWSLQYIAGCYCVVAKVEPDSGVLPDW